MVYILWCDAKRQQVIVKGGVIMAEDMNFKAWMARNNIKQQEIVDYLGISRTEMYNKLHGRSNFTMPQIKKLKEKYDISADIFLVDALPNGNE